MEKKSLFNWGPMNTNQGNYQNDKSSPLKTFDHPVMDHPNPTKLWYPNSLFSFSLFFFKYIYIYNMLISVTEVGQEFWSWDFEIRWNIHIYKWKTRRLWSAWVGSLLFPRLLSTGNPGKDPVILSYTLRSFLWFLLKFQCSDLFACRPESDRSFL